MSSIFIDYKKMREKEIANDIRIAEYREEILEVLMIDKLKPNIKTTLVNTKGVSLENGLLFVFRTNDEELRLYCYFPESVLTDQDREKMVEDSKRLGKSMPHLAFIPKTQFKLIYVQGLSKDSQRPSVVRLTDSSQITSHPFFQTNFK